MNITILCVGKIKENYFRDAISEYEKRLSRYAKVKIVEVKDEKTPDRASLKEEEEIKNTEGQRLLEKLPENEYIVALTLDGKAYSSTEMADHIQDLQVSGKSGITFIIGGSLGLSSEVIKRADEKWSFSRLTFPHQLMRVILLEQIYRSFRILHNEPYHK